MEKNNFRYCFLGTPGLCPPFLEELKKEFGLPIFCITNKDKPVGRKQILTESPVSSWARKNNVNCLKPEKINSEYFKSLPDVDLAVVVAYGQILPQSFIDYPKKGTINVHFSLLPLHRGACPIESSILNGDKITGVSIQQMVKKLDAGPVIAEEKIDLNGNETAPFLEEKLSNTGSVLLVQIITKIIEGGIKHIPQNDNLASFCTKIKKEDGELKNTDSEITKWRKFRAYQPWPRVFYFDNSGKRVIITDAVFENNKFIIKKIIREGEKEKEVKY